MISEAFFLDTSKKVKLLGVSAYISVEKAEASRLFGDIFLYLPTSLFQYFSCKLEQSCYTVF